MGNCISKELEGDNAIEITKKVYQAFLLAKERLADVVYGSEDQWGKDKLKRILDDIDDLCNEYPWLGELSRAYTKPASNKKMIDYIQEPHTTIFTGPTGCRKTHLALELIEKEYNKHFDYIIIICQTLRWNKTYHSKDLIKNDDKVWLVEPKDKLYKQIEKLSQLLVCFETLFIIDDIIADEGLDKRKQPLLELAISGRHRGHYLWLLTQSYYAIPKNL